MFGRSTTQTAGGLIFELYNASPLGLLLAEPYLLGFLRLCNTHLTIYRVCSHFEYHNSSQADSVGPLQASLNSLNSFLCFGHDNLKLTSEEDTVQAVISSILVDLQPFIFVNNAIFVV